jgi:hypothetical protein
MKKEKKNYYVYAGYYELILTDKKLEKPYIFLSIHKSLEKAIFSATKYDSEVNFVFGTEEIREYYIENIIQCPHIFEDEGWEKQYPVLNEKS